MKWWGIFISMALKICLFFPNKAWSHREVHSLSVDSFPVKLKVMSQFLHLYSLEHGACENTSLAAGDVQISPTSSMGCSWKVFFPDALVSWHPTALPQKQLHEREPDLQFCSVNSSPIARKQRFLGGFVISENCLLETWLRHWTSLCTSCQGTIF